MRLIDDADAVKDDSSLNKLRTVVVDSQQLLGPGIVGDRSENQSDLA